MYYNFQTIQWMKKVGKSSLKGYFSNDMNEQTNDIRHVNLFIGPVLLLS